MSADTLPPGVPATARRLAFRPAWLALLLGVIPLIYGADRGFDPRDEAFYLLWILRPDGYAATIHIFGIPLHIAYLALGRSLIALRLAGVLALAGSAAILGAALARHYRERLGVRMPDLPIWAALYGLTFYSFWILTPSYNLLASCGAALVFAGVLDWANRSARWREVFATLCVGVGGTLCFFGKPTLAGLAAPAVAAFLIVQARGAIGRAMRRAAGAGAICVATLVPTIVTTMPLGRFVAMLREGQRVLDLGNSVTALPLKTLREVADASPLWWISLTILGVALWLGTALDRGEASARRLRGLAGAVLVLDLLTLVGAALFGVAERRSPYTAMVLAVPLHATAIALSALAASRSDIETGRRGWAPVAPLFVLLAMPFAVALGTINNILVQTEISSGFTLLLALVATSLWGGGRLVAATRVGAAAVAVLIIWWAAAIPFYYATPITAQNRPERPAFTRDRLRVDAGMDDYMRHLRRLAPSVNGAAVIDLSGLGPGSALLLGGQAPYYPWLAPGFPGVADRADRAWASLTPAQRAGAWVIGPVDRELARSQVVRELRARAGNYTLADRVPGVYWQQRQTLLVWRPRVAGPARDRASGQTIERENVK